MKMLPAGAMAARRTKVIPTLSWSCRRDGWSGGPRALGNRSTPPVVATQDLLALAEASQAEFLVTGDKELLSLKQHASTRIITPVAMIEILKEAESGK
jgi:hypothetical protein